MSLYTLNLHNMLSQLYHNKPGKDIVEHMYSRYLLFACPFSAFHPLQTHISNLGPV